MVMAPTPTRNAAASSASVLPGPVKTDLLGCEAGSADRGEFAARGHVGTDAGRRQERQHRRR